MYITDMGKLFAILLLCLCGLCFGEDSPKCGEVDSAIAYLLEKETAEKDNRHLWAFASLFGIFRTECKCVEKTICRNTNLRTTYRCPDGETISIFDDIQRFVAKMGGTQAP